MDLLRPGASELYDQYWAESGRERAATSLAATAAMALGLQLAFSFLDHFAYPEAFPRFLAMRMAVNALLLWILVRGRFTRPRASMIALPSAVGLEILAMIVSTHAPTSDYYVGLIILFVGMPVLLPLSAHEAAGICGMLTLGFGVGAALEGGDVPWHPFIIHLAFLLTACVESVLSCAYLGRVRVTEFAQRREVERARDELRELDRTKTRFTANVHHELRTPLTLTLTPMEAMLAGAFGPLSDPQRSTLETMHANALRLLKLINNLLDLARIEGQQLALHRRPLEVGRLAEDIVAGARPTAEQRRIELATEGLASLPRICADTDAIEKILTNLIGNALKFTERGGRIEVRGEPDGDGVHLEVRDTGVGIPPDQLERVFDRFAQVDMSATRRHEGTGIGLSLCRELVEMHGGSIWAESPGLGHGTRIHVRLPQGSPDEAGAEQPLAADAEPVLSVPRSFTALQAELGTAEAGATATVADTAANAPPSSEAPPETRVAGVDGADVLVVDDNQDMRQLLRALLEPAFSVRVARNGREALGCIQARPPELVLTDIMMPEMTGTELCRRLKDDPATRAIPVVLVTSKAERSMKIEGLELGADDYVTKPFHPRELLARVRSLIRLRALQRELAGQNEALERANQELEGALEELRAAQTQLVHREKMASLGQLVAGIAHEINNPVNFIQGNLHYLEEYTRSLVGLIHGYEEAISEVAPQLRQRLGALRSQGQIDHVLADLDSVLEGCREGVERTTTLVRDLRTFSRLDQPRRVVINLRETLESTLNLLRGPLSGVSIERRYEGPEEIESLGGQLGQVFMNLLANAADALGGRGQLWVRLLPSGADCVRVEIEDDGPGIEPEHQERIFDPFFTTKEVGKGTGLGLSVTYGIVTRHGGTIQVRSAPGEGTCFRVELPIRMAETSDG